MERENREAGDVVQIPKPAYEGLEFIRRSGMTDMFDGAMVLELAKEWGLDDTAAWIEGVAPDVYGRLIVQGPDVIGNESLDEKLERMDRAYDEARRDFWEGTR